MNLEFRVGKANAFLGLVVLHLFSQWPKLLLSMVCQSLNFLKLCAPTLMPLSENSGGVLGRIPINSILPWLGNLCVSPGLREDWDSENLNASMKLCWQSLPGGFSLIEIVSA